MMRILILVVLASLLLSCRDKLEPEADDFVEYGWVLYEERDYESAFDEFQVGLEKDSLYIDGYNGMGWCYVKFGSPDTAITFFLEGISYIQDDSTQVMTEMLAGLSLSYHRKEDYERAITRGTQLYDLNPVFEFAHDWRIDFEDIAIMLAASNFAQGTFGQSLFWVRKLEPAFTPDINTNEGRAELARKIEQLQNL